MSSVVVCGVDEAGRGPLAGPVYAAAVILDPARRINGLADSKILSSEKREALAGRIKERAIAWSFAHASVEEIDRLNIFHASMLAMQRAVAGLKSAPDEAWIDGNHCPPGLACKARAIVDGDARHKVISAASIIAKTERDAEMRALHERYPAYGFDRHKGYATTDHLDALGRNGPCDVHRRSFYPVGVFFQGDLFRDRWSAMAEALRVRSYRMFCEASRFADVAASAADLGREQRRLKRAYADVFASSDAAPHVELVTRLFHDTRARLRDKKDN
jgi:ribonuclease HII